MQSKKRPKYYEMEESPDSDEGLRDPQKMAYPLKLQASKSNWHYISCFLHEFMTPERKPYMYKFKTDAADSDNFEEFDGDEELFHSEMLHFLYNGDWRRVEATKKLFVKVEKENKNLLKCLDILDTNPAPKSSSLEDCYLWEESVRNEYKKMQADRGPTDHVWWCNSLLSELSAITRSSEENTKEKQAHWRKLLSTFFGLLSEELLGRVLDAEFPGYHPKMKSVPSGECIDTVIIHKKFRPKEQIPDAVQRKNHFTLPVASSRLYEVSVRQEGLLVTDVIKEPHSCLRTLIIEIGSQSIDLQKALTDQSPLRCCIQSSPDGDTGDDGKVDMWESQDNEVPLQETPGGQIIKNQHLLQLAASAVHNKNVLTAYCDMLTPVLHRHFFTTTTGLIIFDNAIFLSKLDSNLNQTVQDVDERGRGTKSEIGKYWLFPAVLNVWKGQWKLLMWYIVACVTGKYLLQNPATHQ